MELKNLPSPRSFVLPGGLLLLAAGILIHTGLVRLTLPLIDSYYAACFGAGVVLAWRLHSTRVALALATLFLAERALLFFSAGHPADSPTIHIAFALISALVPANFLLLSVIEERGFVSSALGERLLFLFLQAVFVAILCRPDSTWGIRWSKITVLHAGWAEWTKLPQASLLAFLTALLVLLVRFISHRKPVESGFFWSLLAAAIAFHFGATGRITTAYLATAALILLTSVIEMSYVMAYHDELTGVPARRAFNEALRALQPPYAIAVVDIDHFKRFNDTYGHDTGDHVLRLVASRLARVAGGGKVYRCGGEEFSIIFSGLPASDAISHLDSLRRSIEHSPFKIRTEGERRSTQRGPDRRTATTRRKKKALPNGADDYVTVTVSIGVAQPVNPDDQVDQVIRAADQALYRAKEGGRNRVEVSTGSTQKGSVRSRRKTASF